MDTRQFASVDHHARLPVRRLTLRTGFRRLTEPPPRTLRVGLDAIRRLDRRAAAEVVDWRVRPRSACARSACDELSESGRGVSSRPRRRSRPHADRRARRATADARGDYGYLMLSNGVPIGYGRGGGRRFTREGPTAEAVTSSTPTHAGRAGGIPVGAGPARVPHDVRRSAFVINGYQFGAGNSEAISSGAYWFYYRLGFRRACPRTWRWLPRRRSGCGATPRVRTRACATSPGSPAGPASRPRRFQRARFLRGALADARWCGCRASASPGAATGRISKAKAG